jgi:hypothetical protein
MPANTPRGYTYPLYGDTQDFPTQIQDFATDVDTDVQSLVDQVAGALDRVSCSLSSATGIVVPNATTTLMTWSTVQYDNDSMAALPNSIVLNDSGIYLLMARVTFDATATAGDTSAQAWFTSSAGFITNPAFTGITDLGTAGKGVTLHALHYTDGTAPDTIQVFVRHNDAAGVNLSARAFVAVKMSNLLTGS